MLMFPASVKNPGVSTLHKEWGMTWRVENLCDSTASRVNASCVGYGA